MKKAQSIRERKDLTLELLLRIAHNQYRINQLQFYIQSVIKTRYKPEFLDMENLFGKVVRFSAQKLKNIDPKEQYGIVADEKVLSTDLLKELEEFDMITSYTEVIPGPELMDEKLNKKYRRLVDPAVKEGNLYHDHNI